VVLVAVLATPASAHAAGSLNLIPDGSVLAANFAVLLLLIWPVHRWLLRPLMQIARRREELSGGARERAAQVAAEAARLEASVAASLQDAHLDARSRQGTIHGAGLAEERRLLQEARQAAAAEIDEVRRGVAAELESARARLREDADDLAREVASKILGRDL
jgi:F-type H+-transporting ATPase subunit b